LNDLNLIKILSSSKIVYGKLRIPENTQYALSPTITITFYPKIIIKVANKYAIERGLSDKEYIAESVLKELPILMRTTPFSDKTLFNFINTNFSLTPDEKLEFIGTLANSIENSIFNYID
jgi:alpha-amylase/alpha-mannosidase (GH57 family)